ncbi:hypothetical protein PCANC_13821 [Puccinia coronata f. sp. avenae]|uniref:Uncharacterized protein n=1 Tax=Puccinia coronata f. sp. avenae TaxID=200324 RepID=A0A2N5SZ97_9BASI|nr:hypothetical protein PCASD_12778 [Puccinia coronata f. sp. avenae]PLW35660.1 hypothetical protein PCANC_13821 [Puccinia coronata f. sp. avenae]
MHGSPGQLVLRGVPLDQAAIDHSPSESSSHAAALVIGTNDSSILSKRSAERLGYFTRPQFLKHFINKPQGRTSLINIGYTIRTLAIDLIIKRFLQNQPPPLKPVVIVNLGCSFTNASYTLLGCDLCDSQQFIHKLLGLIDGKNNAHILFISEVSTVYMPTNRSDELIQNLSLSFPNAIWSCPEHVLSPTPTAFSDTMLKHFQKLRTLIRGTLAYPTLSDQLKRLASRWNKIEMSTTHDIWKAFNQHPATRAEKERLLKLEEFDECSV